MSQVDSAPVSPVAAVETKYGTGPHGDLNPYHIHS